MLRLFFWQRDLWLLDRCVGNRFWLISVAGSVFHSSRWLPILHGESSDSIPDDSGIFQWAILSTILISNNVSNLSITSGNLSITHADDIVAGSTYDMRHLSTGLLVSLSFADQRSFIFGLFFRPFKFCKILLFSLSKILRLSPLEVKYLPFCATNPMVHLTRLANYLGASISLDFKNSQHRGNTFTKPQWGCFYIWRIKPFHATKHLTEYPIYIYVIWRLLNYPWISL